MPVPFYSLQPSPRHSSIPKGSTILVPLSTANAIMIVQAAKVVLTQRLTGRKFVL